MNKKNKKVIAIFAVLFLIIGLISFVVIYIKSSLKPTDKFLRGEICGDATEYCELTPFVVDDGAYGKTTLEKLEAQGIIKDANIVYYWNRILGGYSFYAGYYEIPHEIDGANINLSQLLGWLSNPNNAHQDTVYVELPEGDFAKSFARIIAENLTLKDNPNANDEERYELVLNYWNNEEVVRGYMNDYPFLTEEMFNPDVKVLLEGYLFPDTYEFFEYTSCDEVTRKILDRTLEIYENYEEEFKKSKLTTHQIFTLASIVQWESGDLEDSKKVAGAFLNRIDNPEFEWTGGKLQSTVTACYAFDLSKSECDRVGDATEYTKKEHVYNTYMNEGFTPGPVCCPNEIAMYAALTPDQESGYYFFVANMCDGGTAFARTYDEHMRNIDKYYLACDY